MENTNAAGTQETPAPHMLDLLPPTEWVSATRLRGAGSRKFISSLVPLTFPFKPHAVQRWRRSGKWNHLKWYVSREALDVWGSFELRERWDLRQRAVSRLLGTP